MDLSNTHLLVKYHDYLFNKLKQYTKSEDVKPKSNDIDLNNYIKLTEIELNLNGILTGNLNGNGVDMYLIDEHGLLFKRNDYTFVGFKQNNEITWIN